MSNNETTFSNWLEINQDPDNIFAPPMDAQIAINFLIDYLLGKDWYVSDPISTKQVNTVVVDTILRKYSKKYQKEIKERKKQK